MYVYFNGNLFKSWIILHIMHEYLKIIVMNTCAAKICKFSKTNSNVIICKLQ